MADVDAEPRSDTHLPHGHTLRDRRGRCRGGRRAVDPAGGDPPDLTEKLETFAAVAAHADEETLAEGGRALPRSCSRVRTRRTALLSRT